jgi:hypothetical protein
MKHLYLADQLASFHGRALPVVTRNSQLIKDSSFAGDHSSTRTGNTSAATRD